MNVLPAVVLPAVVLPAVVLVAAGWTLTSLLSVRVVVGAGSPR